MIAVYDWLDETGAIIGCGTQYEFDHWQAVGTLDGCSVGKRIAWESPSMDAKRAAAWKAEREAA